MLTIPTDDRKARWPDDMAEAAGESPEGSHRSSAIAARIESCITQYPAQMLMLVFASGLLLGYWTKRK